jgi:excisionase family DNA binding protein
VKQPEDQRYSVQEVAAQVRLHPSTVYRMIAIGRLTGERHGTAGRTIRVTAAALAAYLEAAAR